MYYAWDTTDTCESTCAATEPESADPQRSLADQFADIQRGHPNGHAQRSNHGKRSRTAGERFGTVTLRNSTTGTAWHWER